LLLINLQLIIHGCVIVGMEIGTRFTVQFQSQCSQPPGPVSTWMGDHLQMGKPFRCVTCHPGLLSLAILPWVGAMSTSESWDVN